MAKKLESSKVNTKHMRGGASQTHSQVNQLRYERLTHHLKRVRRGRNVSLASSHTNSGHIASSQKNK